MIEQPPDLDAFGKPIASAKPPDLDEHGNPVAEGSAPKSFLDKLGGWRGLAGSGIRVGSGLLSSEGGFLGAGISGLGEGLAELAEGSDFSPTKIGVEAGFGAIPFGKVIKGGKMLSSAAKSGAVGAAHSAVSDIAGGATPDIERAATSGGLGALLGAGGAAWAGRANKPVTYEIQPTAQTGPGTRTLNYKGKGAVDTTPIQPIHSSGVPIQAAPAATDAAERIPYGGTSPAPYRSAAKQNVRETNRLSDMFGSAVEKKNAAMDQEAADVLANKAAKEEIERKIAEAGLEKGAPVVTEGVKATGDNGEALSARTTWAQPKEDDAPPTRMLLNLFSPPKTSTELNIAPSVMGHPDVAPALEAATPAIEKTVTPAAAAVSEALPPVQPGETVLAQMMKPKRTPKAKVNSVDKFNQGVDDILGATPAPSAAPPAAAPSVPVEAPQVQHNLPELYRPHLEASGGHTGKAYRMIKQAVAEGNAPPELAAHAREIQMSYLEAQKAAAAAPKVEPLAADAGARSATLPEAGVFNGSGTANKNAVNFIDQLGDAAAHQTPGPETAPQGADWIQQELDEVAKRRGNQGGFINPSLISGATGALVGAPIGAEANPDDPYGAVKGALAGGLIGYGGVKGAMKGRASGKGMIGGATRELTNQRNAGLLLGPAQIKKPLSDLGAVITDAAERMMTSGKQEQGTNILKELFRVPTNVSNYGAALKDPNLAGEVIGDRLSQAAPAEQGLLGLVGRPFGAAQYATQQVLQRAGVPAEEARKILFLGDPESKLGKWWMSAQDPRITGQFGSNVVKAVRPFARIATNLAERGIQRTPGLSLMTGDPETRMARTALGTGAMMAGGMTGMADSQLKENGEEPPSALVRGLRRAAMASYGLPFIAGEAMTGPGAMSDLYYAIPGLNSPVKPPAPNESIMSYTGKSIRNWLNQLLPGSFDLTNQEKPLR